MKKTVLFILVCFVASYSLSAQSNVTMEQVENEKKAGNFTLAKKMIDHYIAENNLSEGEIYNLNCEKDIMNRIILDFSKSKEDVVGYIRKYYPDVNDSMLEKWQADNSLESMIIDGRRCYFNRAAANLFRINKEAKKRKEEVDGGVQKDNVEKVLETHLPQVIAELKKTSRTQAEPVSMTVKYTVTLAADAVPDGEMVSCWLPYPREDNRRQGNIKLIWVNDDDYVIAPSSYPQRTLFMQKKVEKGKPLTFSFQFSYTSAAEWFDLVGKKIEPYDTAGELYKKYTAEREKHVVFTEKIKELSDKIVGNEKKPYRIVRKIFDYINDNFPWAGAREYSTLPDIPSYVLANHHGDCGQVSLLFITLARYNGIPAKWQSGFMMHPNGLNLHDWAEVYYEGIGWVPVDQSFGRKDFFGDEDVKYLFSNGIDAYRWIVNDDFSQPLFPAKIYPRSETVDFQRGELEWRGGNVYFDKWNWDIEVEYAKP